MGKTATLKRVIFMGILLLGLTNLSDAQFRYENEPVLQIIENIQQQTSFRFLYRDALVSDIRLSFASDNTQLLSDFRKAIHPYQLDLKVDSTRNQVIIFQQKSTSANPKKISIRGQVVDASTGERLPYATILWQEQNMTKGTSANQSGVFRIHRTIEKKSLEIRCSYVGYASKTVELDVTKYNGMQELTFRLQPERIDGNQLIVTGTTYYDNINQQTSDLVDIGTFSPIGESNTLRALQTLPSVSLAPALSDGLHVRGSPTDGFQVLVDGVTIYNQSHLFGLVDSFNADVLKRGAFFYDIAPAQFQAPPGGTLSLSTKTGSMDQFSGTAGVSNSSLRLALEGPIKAGQSSWLLAGRTSFMNTVNWLNNTELIQWGLNTNRDRQVLDDGLIDFQSLLVSPQETEASFFDLHGKIYLEGNQGNRLVLSGYFGGDDTRQDANRLFRTFSSSGPDFQSQPITTTNDWYNAAGSAQYHQWLNENIYSSSTVGATIYNTSFSKEDFTYIRHTNQSLQAFVFPFENQSVLNEIKAEQQLEFIDDPWLLTGGLSYHYFLGEYFEDSFNRLGFFSSQQAHKIDTYVQLDYSGFDLIDIFAGTRMHYYTSGTYLKWSPRLKLKLFPDSKLSISGGYSRNYQFLNQISLSNTVTSDVWILAGNNQPPTSVDYYSAGIYFAHTNQLYLQAEAYIKEFENVRLHEINSFSLSNTFNNNPWYTQNRGTGKGVELLMRNQFRFATLTQTLSVSEMKLSNPAINNGDPFLADWDRTYRYTTSLQFEPVDDLSFYLSWMYATGTPNKLATFGPQDNERLGHYSRADISAEYKQQFQNVNLNLSISVFNLFDRQNPWYRELTFVVDRTSSQNRFRTVPVDVYDLGFQPSFNVSVGF